MLVKGAPGTDLSQHVKMMDSSNAAKHNIYDVPKVRAVKKVAW